MEAQLLDVAEDEKCIFDLTVLHELLEILVFNQVLVDQLLSIREREPDYEVSF